MKRALKNSLSVLTVLLVVGLLFSCNSSDSARDEETAAQYTCPMHPQIVKDEPGKCPICHMELVPVKRGDKKAEQDTSLESLVKPANEVVVSQIRTIEPAEGVRGRNIELRGVINYNSNNWRSISSRVSGRIERLYVKYNFQYVSKGQRLFDVYSPDLVNAQQELIYLKSSGDRNLVESAKIKLRTLGASEAQINSVVKTGRISTSIPVYSPYSGYVSERAAQPSAPPSGSTVISEEGSGNMNSMGASSSANAPQVPRVETGSVLQLKEGQYIGLGQKVFTLINPDNVWAEFSATAEQVQNFKRGTLVQVSATDIPEQKVISKVELVQPFYSETSKFSLIRVQIPNMGKTWKIGQLVNLQTEADTKFGVWLPKSSVLALGNSKHIVFLGVGKSFQPRYVDVVERRGDWVDIGKSLGKNSSVAVNAWFMVDSESFLKVDSI